MSPIEAAEAADAAVPDAEAEPSVEQPVDEPDGQPGVWQ
jgi:hypothetical protein